MASEKNGVQRDLDACRKEVAESTKPPEPGVNRLPTKIEPISYDILIEPLLPNDIVNGTVTIKITAKEATNYIQLNQHGLLIQDKSVIIECDNDGSINIVVISSYQL